MVDTRHLRTAAAVLCALYCSGAQAVVSGDTLPAEIRVSVFPHIFKYRIPQGAESVVDSIEIQSAGPGLCNAYSAPDAAGLAPFSPPAEQVPLRSGRELRFKVDELDAPLRIVCDSEFRIKRELPLRSYRYTGQLQLGGDRTADGREFVRAVNIVPMESYLKGVVPSEMPASWPEAALRAQAIAARTYAYYELLEARRNNPERQYDVDDTVYYQVYTGSEDRNRFTDAAIDATAGHVIFHAGAVIKAFFHANSGGHTEDAANVWGFDAPYVVGKPEVFDPSLDPKNGWSAEFTVSQLNTRLAEAGLIPAASGIVNGASVVEEERHRSGRASRVRLALADGTEQLIAATEFAYALRLKSTWFSIQPVAGRLRFSGKGYGHGVGMSQVGARILAGVLGWDEQKILGFYYTGVELLAAGLLPQLDTKTRLRKPLEPVVPPSAEPFEPKWPARQEAP